MFGFMFNYSKKMKGFKITDNSRTRKYGVGAVSLEMLKEKAKSRFSGINDPRVYLAFDGTEVLDEEYFQTLEAQTLLVIAEASTDIITQTQYEYQKLQNRIPMAQLSDIIANFMERHPNLFRKIIKEYENNVPHMEIREKTLKSKKDEHEEWFHDSDRRCNNKEEALSKRAQDRIRGYYYKTKEELTKISRNEASLDKVDDILAKFRYLLIACNYFSMIFDRTHEKRHESLLNRDQTDATGTHPLPSKRVKEAIKDFCKKNHLLDKWMVSLCNEDGDFYCQGSYSEGAGNICKYQHVINPYASRENLILFQVWNLDHQIELTRSVIPSLVENVQLLLNTKLGKLKCTVHPAKNVIDVSVVEYFLEIFSLKNLKLVHIVCHEKIQRSENLSHGRLICELCDEYLIMQDLINEINSLDEVDAWLACGSNVE
ncbi:DFFB family protein [Megaselia abdita]